MFRVTIACPENLIPQANQLALCLGLSAEDVHTYGLPSWQDKEGNLYALASTSVADTFQETASSMLVEPPWGADMEAAGEAQKLIRVGEPASPNTLSAIFSEDTTEALALLAVFPVVTKGEEIE